MKTYTIREVSERFSLPASTLRYYEEVGLLTEVMRDGKHRMYQDCHLNRLSALCCFKETGMSIAQLQTFFSYEKDANKNQEMVELLAEHTEKVSAQIMNLQKNMQHVQRKLAFYQDICRAEQSQQPMPEWNDYRDKVFPMI